MEKLRVTGSKPPQFGGASEAFRHSGQSSALCRTKEGTPPHEGRYLWPLQRFSSRGDWRGGLSALTSEPFWSRVKLTYLFFPRKSRRKKDSWNHILQRKVGTWYMVYSVRRQMDTSECHPLVLETGVCVVCPWQWNLFNRYKLQGEETLFRCVGDTPSSPQRSE